MSCAAWNTYFLTWIRYTALTPDTRHHRLFQFLSVLHPWLASLLNLAIPMPVRLHAKTRRWSRRLLRAAFCKVLAHPLRICWCRWPWWTVCLEVICRYLLRNHHHPDLQNSQQTESSPILNLQASSFALSSHQEWRGLSD